METTLHPTTKSQFQQCKKCKNLLLVDRVSELPDEILVSILSLVTMKEAASTSILSRRWKNLWKHITCLDFDNWNVLREIDGWYLAGLEDRSSSLDVNHIIDRLILYQLGNSTDLAFLRQKQSNYIKWVDQILDSHKGPTIDNFRVHFDLNVTFQAHIDRWVNLAMGKRVQRLELDLERVTKNRKGCYPFPVKILDDPNISFLRALSLNYVDVTNEVLDSLLSKIPSVEFLRVSSSESLLGAFVFSASPNLKHLEIAQCVNLKNLQIEALNLRSLTFVGPRTTRLRLENTPNLVAVSFGGRFCQRAYFVLPKFPPTSHFCSQLQMLTLNIAEVTCGFFPDIPVLGNLKQLELILKVTDGYGILDCTSLIKACPVLCKLMLQFNWWDLLEKNREVQREIFLLPDSLKMVELRKFRGGTTDVEMAIFLFENAKFLQEICIDTRNPDMVDRHLLDQTILEAKKCGRQLATQLCPNAELVVI